MISCASRRPSPRGARRRSAGSAARCRVRSGIAKEMRSQVAVETLRRSAPVSGRLVRAAIVVPVQRSRVMKSVRVGAGAALALCLVAGQASGQITPIGPFTGPYTEGFETQTAGVFTLCIQGRIFNNTADACEANNNPNMHITSGWGFFCSIYPHSGARLSASAGGPVKITFDAPVSQFGGYFGTNSGVDGAVVTFYDAANNTIGMANL